MLKEKMKYFKREWDEPRGDEYNSWGTSEWWFETDNDGHITRCIQRYQNGNVLLYSDNHKEDKYGKLPEGALDFDDFKDYAITKEEFEKILNSLHPINELG